jgi:hypothetical protein
MATAVIPPPYFITADDKRGLIVVTVALVLAFVWTCSLIRIWLRWQKRDWKADDWLLAFATVSGRRPVCAHVFPIDAAANMAQAGPHHPVRHNIPSGQIRPWNVARWDTVVAARAAWKSEFEWRP